MASELAFIVVVVSSYLIGSIPFGVVFSAMFGLGDLRKIGSGNIGATNVLRTGRKGIAALTLLGDMLKGTAAVYVSGRLFGADLQIVAAAVAVVGHVFPVWLRFKGGKGVATYLGVALALSPLAGAVFVGIWLITALVSRYSSLSALVASAVTPFVLGYVLNVRVGIVFLILTGLLFWKHSANIKRLMSGTESRIGSGDGKESKESKRTRRS